MVGCGWEMAASIAFINQISLIIMDSTKNRHFRKTGIVFSIAILSLLLFSCSNKLNDKEKQLVGDWNCAQIEEMEEDGVPYEILFEEDIQFKEDKTLYSDGYLKIKYSIEGGFTTETIQCKLTFQYNGTWEIENDNLTLTIEDPEVQLSDLKSSMDNEFDELDEFKEIFEDRTTVMRHELLGKHKFEIVDFSSHQLTLKDDEGEISTYKRTKR